MAPVQCRTQKKRLGEKILVSWLYILGKLWVIDCPRTSTLCFSQVTPWGKLYRVKKLNVHPYEITLHRVESQHLLPHPYLFFFFSVRLGENGILTSYRGRSRTLWAFNKPEPPSSPQDLTLTMARERGWGLGPPLFLLIGTAVTSLKSSTGSSLYAKH